jgi:type I restriction enzyme S subunit
MARLNAEPRGWTVAPLSEVVTLNPRGFSKNPGDDELLSFIPMAAVGAQTGQVDLAQTRTWKSIRSGYSRFQDGDVLFAKITPCMENGKFAVASDLVGGRGAGSTEFHVLRPADGIDPKLVLYFLFQNGLRRAARARMKGAAGQLRVPAVFFDEIQLPLAPSAEQHRIVAEIEKLFTRLEAAVAALKRAQANLKRYRASVLKAACEGRLVPTEAELARAEGRAYEPGNQLLNEILELRLAEWKVKRIDGATFTARSNYREPVEPDIVDLSSVPEGWVVASIDQLTSVITSGSRDWSKYYGQGTGTFLMAQNIRLGRLDLESRQAVDPPLTDRDRKRSQVRVNDLLVTIVGANTGDLCRVPTSLPEHFVCQSVALMRPVDPDCARFLTLYMTSPENGQRQFRRYIYGAGRPHLSFDQLKTTAVALPPLAEQRRIVAEAERRLSVIYEIETAVVASLRRIRGLRQAILKRAFEGKLALQDSTDEPASVLLDRIKAARAEAAAKAKRQPQRGVKAGIPAASAS